MDKNASFLHKLACLPAFYAEKGYYLGGGWLLLMGNIVTTYG